MKLGTQPTDIFFSNDGIQVCVYGEGDTREVAEKIVPQAQALLEQGLAFARGCLREPYDCELESVSVFERNDRGVEIELHCSYDSEDCGALPGDLSIDFAFNCGWARQSGWQMPPKCVRFSVRVS